MSSESANQDLLAMWKRSMDEGMEAWRKLVGQPQGADLFLFWRPLFGQGADPWFQLLKQGATSPDTLAQWKRFMDDSIEAWSKVLGQAMETEGFAAAMGKFLDQYLGVVGPMRKSLQSSSEEFLRSMNLPSRKQIADLASQVISLEMRLEPLEEQMEKLADGIGLNTPPQKLLTDLAAQVGTLQTGLKALEKRMVDLSDSLSRIEGFVRRMGEEEPEPAPRKMKPAKTPKGTSPKEA